MFLTMLSEAATLDRDVSAGIMVLLPNEESHGARSTTGGDRGGVGGTPRSSFDTVEPSEDVWVMDDSGRSEEYSAK